MARGPRKNVNRDLVRHLLVRHKRVSERELEYVHHIGNAAMEILNLREIEHMPISTDVFPETNEVIWTIPENWQQESGETEVLWPNGVLVDTTTRAYIAEATASGRCVKCGSAPRFVAQWNLNTLRGLCPVHGPSDMEPIPQRSPGSVKFEWDLALGEVAEGKFKRILEADGDTVEIKRDMQADATGNVFLEWGRDGRPSGLQISQADWLAVFARDRWFVLRMETARGIIRMCMGDKSRWVTNAGDGGRTQGALIPLSMLASSG